MAKVTAHIYVGGPGGEAAKDVTVSSDSADSLIRIHLPVGIRTVYLEDLEKLVKLFRVVRDA